MLKASEFPSDGWDGGDGVKAPRPGRGESPQYRLAVFFRKTAKPGSSFAPGQTRFIAVSPTCVWVPKVCRCLPGSDLEAAARQLLRAQTCFLLPYLPLRVVLPGSTETTQSRGQSRGRVNGDWLWPWGAGNEPIPPPVGESQELVCCGAFTALGRIWEEAKITWFLAQRGLVPFNQFDVPNFSKWFLVLGKKNSLPP